MMNLPNNIISARWIHGLPHDRFIRDEIIHDEIIVGWNFHRINLLPIKSSHEKLFIINLPRIKMSQYILNFHIINLLTIKISTLKPVKWKMDKKYFIEGQFSKKCSLYYESAGQSTDGADGAGENESVFFFRTDSLMDSPTYRNFFRPTDHRLGGAKGGASAFSPPPLCTPLLLTPSNTIFLHRTW